MNEDIKRLVEPYRVRFLGTPDGGVQAVEVNGRSLTVAVAARAMSRLASLTTKETDQP